MVRAIRYPLLLLLAVLLALPSGWCCLVVADVRAAAPETPQPEPCCCCPPAPVGDDEAPARPVRCCCGDRDLLVTKGPEPDHNQTSALAYLPPLPLEPLLTVARPEALVLPPPPTRPLHLLRCVWLC